MARKKTKKTTTANKLRKIPFKKYRKVILAATPSERKEIYKFREAHKKKRLKQEIEKKLGVAEPKIKYKKILKRIGADRFGKKRFKSTFFDRLAKGRRY